MRLSRLNESWSFRPPPRPWSLISAQQTYSDRLRPPGAARYPYAPAAYRAPTRRLRPAPGVPTFRPNFPMEPPVSPKA